MKKKKIRLQKLKVSSFLTSIDLSSQEVLKGGNTYDYTITDVTLPPPTNGVEAGCMDLL